MDISPNISPFAELRAEEVLAITFGRNLYFSPLDDVGVTPTVAHPEYHFPGCEPSRKDHLGHTFPRLFPSGLRKLNTLLHRLGRIPPLDFPSDIAK
jgi:hypothetical protein